MAMLYLKLHKRLVRSVIIRLNCEGIARQIGHCMGVNFNIHIWAWSASPSVQVGGL